MQFLDEETRLRLIAGVPNILAPALAARQEKFSRLVCPTCGGRHIVSEVTVEHLRSATDPLPDGDGRCTDCQCLFSPSTGLIYEDGQRTEE